MTLRFNPPLVWTLIWALFFGALVIVSLALCDGHLIYTLDDPYIHLAVADNILHGNFGINRGEASSPVSSVLYPLLLTPTVALGMGSFGALLINIFATGFSVWLLLDFFWRYAGPAPGSSTLFGHFLSPLLLLSLSAFALPMTGMEHSLHILTIVVTLRALIQIAGGSPLSLWGYIAISCMPFIRLEGAALCGATLIALMFVGQRRAALWLSLVLVTTGVAWVVTMQHLGLPIWPTSVLAKSAIATNGMQGHFWLLLKTAFQNAELALQMRWGLLFALALCALLPGLQPFLRQPRAMSDPGAIIAFVGIASLLAHLLCGSYGWFFRYEVYVVTITVMTLIYLYRHWLSSLFSPGHSMARVAVLFSFFLLVAPYAEATFYTPVAARNIYEQQYQMHRFVTDFFPRRTAVNDLGLVAFQNPNFVLDLWGLGSEQVRQLRAEGRFDAAAAAKLASQEQVDFAMIYDSWFVGGVPKTWCLLATLDSEQVVAGAQSVMFYATRPASVVEMNEALDRFEPTLPARDRLTRITRPCSSS